jgi:hypothetical protein
MRLAGASALASLLAVLGPGLLAGLSDDDPAGITTYSILGAEHGYRLLWIIPASTVLLVQFHLVAVRIGAATGKGFVAVVRERWNSNPRERGRMLQHAERWQRMTPGQRRSAEEGKRRWEQMSPEQRKEARAAFERGRGLPPAERAELRERLKAMTPEERREWLRTHRNPRERSGSSTMLTPFANSCAPSFPISTTNNPVSRSMAA